jgi:hypothetical protein
MTQLAIIRGDSSTVRIPVSWDGSLYDATDEAVHTITWTLKRNPNDPDTSAAVQKMLGAGITAGEGWVDVELVPIDTQDMPTNVVFVWDVQVQETNGAIRTVATGALTIAKDITRETTISVPVYTLQPPTVAFGEQGTAVYSVAGKTGTVTLDKSDVGLGNVDNTSDASKPVSTATQTAIDTAAAGTASTKETLEWAGTSTALNVIGTGDLLDDNTRLVAVWAQASGTVSIIVGDEADDNRYVAEVELAAGQWKPLTLLAYNWDGTNGEVLVKPSASYTGTIKIEIIESAWA